MNLRVRAGCTSEVAGATYAHRVRSTRVLLVIVLAGLCALAGCGSSDVKGASSKIPALTSVWTTTDYDFTAETVADQPFEGTSLAGKDVVLWFWAPWCPQCKREAPFVATAQAANTEVTFVGVAGLGQVSSMQKFVKDYKLSDFEHLADVDGSLWQRFGVTGQPAYAFIDGETGKVDVLRGELGQADISRRTAALTGN